VATTFSTAAGEIVLRPLLSPKGLFPLGLLISGIRCQPKLPPFSFCCGASRSVGETVFFFFFSPSFLLLESKRARPFSKVALPALDLFFPLSLSALHAIPPPPQRGRGKSSPSPRARGPYQLPFLFFSRGVMSTGDPFPFWGWRGNPGYHNFFFFEIVISSVGTCFGNFFFCLRRQRVPVFLFRGRGGALSPPPPPFPCSGSYPLFWTALSGSP